jgi:acyl-CoA thioesterase YciA
MLWRETLDTDAVAKRTPAIRTTAMPTDTNSAGDIFGSWLMAQMDLAAGNVAARRGRRRGTCYADVVLVGRTPMRIKVEA